VKISKIYHYNLRNDAHFQFHMEFRDLILDAGAENLRVSPLFDEYLALYDREDEGLNKITKSVLTQKIREEYKIRGKLYAGMTEITSAALKHPREDVREAAKRMKILFGTYGNISKMPINEQTSAVTNILQELKGDYARDANLIGLSDYIAALENRNNALETFVKERYRESTAKTDVVIGDARKALDAAYDRITARINALALIEGGELYENLIKTLNTVIAAYNAALNVRHGRKKRKAADGETAEGAGTEMI